MRELVPPAAAREREPEMESIINDLAALDAESWASIPEIDRAAVEAEVAREVAEMTDMAALEMMATGGPDGSRREYR